MKESLGRRKEIVVNKLVKIILLLFAAVYIVSPVDAAPGPIDDAVVLLISLAAKKALSSKIDER